MTKGAAVRRSLVTTSLPMLYASTLSYLLKASIVLVYSFKILVDHEGWIRSMEPFKGKERSMLSLGINSCNTNGDKNEHGVDPSCAETAHATVMVEGGIDTVDTNGVDPKLCEVRNIAGAAVREREGVYEVGRFAERVVRRLYNETCETL